jgi:hypothetical protein
MTSKAAAARAEAARNCTARAVIKGLEAQLAGLQADVDGLLQRRAAAQRQERLRAVMARHAAALLELSGMLAAPGPDAAASAAAAAAAAPSPSPPSCGDVSPACIRAAGQAEAEAEAQAFLQPAEQPPDGLPDVPLNWGPAEAAAAAAEPGFEASVPGLLQCACDFVQATSPIVM